MKEITKTTPRALSLPFFRKNEEEDVAHAVFACDFVVVINVKFADNCLVCILLCKLPQQRGQA